MDTEIVEQTLEAIDTLMLQRSVGDAADRVLLEEKLEGREVSLMALVDGSKVVPLAPACDYKRALDGDHGANTGGMGGYSPVSFFTEAAVASAVDHVLAPVVTALREQGTPYQGCLYAGLMVGPSGVQVLEYNARFGDPETQIVMPRLDTDLIGLLDEAARGELSHTPSWSNRATVGVVLASRGYPAGYQTGFPIDGLGRLEPDVFAFHAGTASEASGYVTAGGRVLTLVARDDTIAAARERAYRNAERLHFEGMTYRRDLALREVEAPAVP